MSSRAITASILALLRERYLEDVSIEDVVSHISQRDDLDVEPTANVRPADRTKAAAIGGEAASESTMLARRIFADMLAKKLLEQLNVLGLVHLKRENRLMNAGNIVSARISNNFLDIQNIIGFSLTEASRRDRIPMSPIFGRPSRTSTDVFIIMPFSNAFHSVFRTIRVCCENLGLTVSRGDDVFGSKDVMDGIWAHIYGSRVLIVDCTGKNANVFYELGIAHTVGNAKVILLTQDANDIPFDLRHRQFIVYNTSQIKSDDGYSLAVKLTERLAAIFIKTM